ncbi:MULTISPECIES: hypothetical protein [Pseudomonas aeruginosa group]|uniref:Uncharacterized protein n=3 Tax=Pseudomonas aeruginosa group TaxID=136841 RepID=A0ABD7JXC8_PSEAI|nr:MULTISPECIES: hypothetical protein [Pseudomonas aeruginosa group]VTS23895.1 Uncharacterised protein [Streptococcus dysgalactiae subsp. equisimilis]ABR85902.1 hypothetical protein PSPA7_2451 [Pseudomonas aeruginosa PA7]AVK03226.1 hypothetical protein CSB93_3723 [Pseudomonas paraeruginosa]AVR67508.1 hypothetical protein B7D75_11265 [Pseudomonas paraeruginosa]AWE93354.1 hypothetical protein CSC28_2505 [Pseudomonas paraeruginosa]
MNKSLDSDSITTAIMALRRLRDTHPEQYRELLPLCASGLVETLVGQSDGDDRRKTETQSETIARWTWLQLLGWAQNNSLSPQQIESLYSIVEGIRSCRPLMQERARLLQLARG